MAPKAKDTKDGKKEAAEMPRKSAEPRKSNNLGKSSTKLKKKAVSGSTKAGLIFPVGRTSRHLRQGRYCDRSGKGAAIFLAAVLEYLTCEILELAGNACEEQGRKTIAPRHLQLAVRNDEELAKLMAATMIANGGYMSNIHPFLLKGKKGGGKKEKEGATQEI